MGDWECIMMWRGYIPRMRSSKSFAPPFTPNIFVSRRALVLVTDCDDMPVSTAISVGMNRRRVRMMTFIYVGDRLL